MNVQEKYRWIILYNLLCTSCHPGLNIWSNFKPFPDSKTCWSCSSFKKLHFHTSALYFFEEEAVQVILNISWLCPIYSFQEHIFALFTFQMIIYVESFQTFLRWVILVHCSLISELSGIYFWNKLQGEGLWWMCHSTSTSYWSLLPHNIHAWICE